MGLCVCLIFIYFFVGLDVCLPHAYCMHDNSWVATAPTARASVTGQREPDTL